MVVSHYTLVLVIWFICAYFYWYFLFIFISLLFRFLHSVKRCRSWTYNILTALDHKNGWKMTKHNKNVDFDYKETEEAKKNNSIDRKQVSVLFLVVFFSFCCRLWSCSSVLDVVVTISVAIKFKNIIDLIVTIWFASI